MALRPVGLVPADAVPAAVPLEHFAKLAAYEQIAISPSGEHVAIKTPMEDRSGVAIVRLDDMKMTGALKLSQGFHVYDLHWLSLIHI